MADVYKKMPSDDDEDFPGKCKERRRRRIEMRRLAAISTGGSSPPAIQSRRGNLTESWSSVATEVKRIRKAAERTASTLSRDETPAPAPALGMPIETPTPGVEKPSEALVPEVGKPSDAPAPASTEPVYGTMSVAGRSREMEDAIAVKTSLCKPEINGRRPVHFFGVYDGHGGAHVAALCREKMHVLLEEELMRVDYTVKGGSGDGESSGSRSRKAQKATVVVEGDPKWEATWTRVMKRSYARMDKAALATCACGNVGFHTGCHPVAVALGGSTAVVAVLTEQHILVANCGDSRAVLCRGGRAIPLSTDHKPDRSDELARIEAAGGRVIFLNGARVEGILAMSRAIGDKFLKPVVISEPEITFTKREPADECLILASDGLWDVLSSDMACEVACECLQETNPPVAVNSGPCVEDEGELYPSQSLSAAALLTRLALGRRSYDNISVIVVDFKRKSKG